MTEAEFKAAFHQHKDALYRFGWRMTGSPDAAEDIAQEAFLTLWREPALYDPHRGELRAFLFGVARNLALKFWRKENRWAPLEEGDDFAQPLDLARGETADYVAAAVQALPPLQREALILAEYEELPLEEIARAVEAEIGTVKSRLHRARENLRRMLAPLKEPNARSRYGTAQ
jgi:RNA polymerase sigma-70 factor (ECF subfamily)